MGKEKENRNEKIRGFDSCELVGSFSSSLSKSLIQKQPKSWGSRPLALLVCIGRASTGVGITGLLWLGNGRGGGFGGGAVADLTD